MQIAHKIDKFLITLFPELQGINDIIINTLKKHCTFGQYSPTVTIKEDFIIVDIDTSSIISQEINYNKTISFCEQGKFAEAKPILKKLIEKNQTNSEYHILAYYYVSWSLAMPEVVHKLQLPFIEEYKLAYSMHKPQ